MREIEKAEKELGLVEVVLRGKAPQWTVTNLRDALSYKARDWYSVSLADLQQIGWPSRITKAQLANMLSRKYPNEDWDKVFLLRGKYAQQRRLERAVKSLFPVCSQWRTLRQLFTRLFIISLSRGWTLASMPERKPS